ncbi:MAG: transcription-repair coupling factor [Muribaculaceae bacterium]|nr:transcription-repair coupling factor [Muribaculaceae bacterium]
MTLKDAAELFATRERLSDLDEAIGQRGPRRVRLTGLPGSAPAMLFSGLKKRKTPYIIVADDPDTAGYMYHDLCQIAGEQSVAIFPSGYKRDIKYGQPDEAARILRTDALNAWSKNPQLRWLVTSPEALAEKVPAPARLDQHTLSIKSGGRWLMTDIIKRLREEGFKETDYVYEPGQFARRGSILDIFSYSNTLPYRLDFFDDEIDSIRIFNIETQLSEERVSEIAIVPGNTSEDPDGISLLEFAGSSTVLLCQSAAHTLSRVGYICSETFSESAMIADEGDRDAMSKTVNYDALAKAMAAMRVVDYGYSDVDSTLDVTTTTDPENGASRKNTVEHRLHYDCSLQTLYHKNFDLIADSFRGFLTEGYRILILSDTVHQTDRLRSIFEDRKDDIQFTPVDRTIHEGFVDRDRKICYFTDHQIFDRFHKYNLKSDRTRSGKLALSLKELGQIEAGDYIVHVDHGIGRFGGLIRTDVNGHPQEMIKLLYQNDDIILVSIHALHKLSKYRGKEGVPPKVSKLGTGAWQRIKDRTKTKMKDIARDLIKLYAARRNEKGFAFSPDSYMQHELEASFIYEDTPDQLSATQAIKRDMESDRPMDRLVCGDVGFGKTELAIRAAFKAAVDGKQTAVLVPTTVLAMQHYHTFAERLKDLPVRVDFISRARKPKDVKRILGELEDGKIDILIGTHKLIGKSVKFKDLGLLVVDEEQKFGVAVKEKLKQMKVNVDTLTLSATPIPRTLQFSLMGARDLSSLNTPPQNRQPVMTTVAGFDDDILSEAINFELSRNGQIFVISDRIQNLRDIEGKLRELVPGVRIITAHGQMPPEQLEKAILDFAAHDYDILLSTTIVENGIDMPNVNTIIINNAHHFGLSELHQLRGRVGRSSRKAFCYMLTPPGLPLPPVARRRLQAIESFSDLGSGIHIAMQDLDIRGAGNLLGAEQSGFIADLGYETYQKILKEAVIELKTEEFGDKFEDVVTEQNADYVSDCTIESDLELRLPGEYVPQESERIHLYQQLDNMEREEDVRTFAESLRDRFGRIPHTTEELLKIVPLRMLARRLGIERLILKGGKMILHFVTKDNRAYYESPAFGSVLSYIQRPLPGISIREINNRLAITIADVTTVSAALEILRQMRPE